jgi:hypothetical protein
VVYLFYDNSEICEDGFIPCDWSELTENLEPELEDDDWIPCKRAKPETQE